MLANSRSRIAAGVVAVALIATGILIARASQEPGPAPVASDTQAVEVVRGAPDTRPDSRDDAVARLDRILESGRSRGRIALVDPASGALGGRQAGAAPLPTGSARSSDNLRRVDLEGGGQLIDLEGRFMTSLVVELPAEDEAPKP